MILQSRSENYEGRRGSFVEEVALLAEQATNRFPVFNAAMRFFSVNYKVLLGLGGSVTTYVILLLQIYNQKFV